MSMIVIVRNVKGKSNGVGGSSNADLLTSLAVVLWTMERLLVR